MSLMHVNRKQGMKVAPLSLNLKEKLVTYWPWTSAATLIVPLLKKFAHAEIIWGDPNNYFLENLKERDEKIQKCHSICVTVEVHYHMNVLVNKKIKIYSASPD